MNGIKPPTLMRAVRGPIILITIGSLFALDHMTEYSIGRTFPAVIIVLGLLMLGERFTAPRPNELARRDSDFGSRP
jgi:hypothetical protein